MLKFVMATTFYNYVGYYQLPIFNNNKDHNSMSNDDKFFPWGEERQIVDIAHRRRVPVEKFDQNS